MNLTHRPPYVKCKKRGSKPKRNRPTRIDRLYWKVVAALGCIVAGLSPCEGRITIHHCGTGAGGRKNHRKVIPLCWGHHLGPRGIDGQRLSKTMWQDVYGTEPVLLKKVDRLLSISGISIKDNDHAQ